MDTLSIKVEPEDTFIWDENSHGRINIPGKYETILENTGNSAMETEESVSSCWVEGNQNEFKEEEVSDASQEIENSVTVKSEPVSSCWVEESLNRFKKEEISDTSQEIEMEDIPVQVIVHVKDEEPLAAEKTENGNIVDTRNEDSDVREKEPSGNLPQDVITESNLQTVIRRGNRSTSDDELPPQKCPRFSERIRKQKMAESVAVTEESSNSCSNQLEDKVPSHNTCKPSAFVADDISSDEGGGEYGNGHVHTQPLAAAAADMPSTSSKHTPYVASSRRISNHRVWNLYSYCLYCYQKETRLLRHCRRQHTSEELVAEAMALEECNSDAAHRIWSKIRNLGNHAHNKEVLLGRAVDLIVRKRPENGKSRAIDDYVPCSDCLGYFNTRSLWIHKKTCYERDHSLKGSQHVKEGRSLLPLKLTIHDQLKKVVDGMVHDDITLIAKNDKFILHVGQNEMDKSNSFKKDTISREKMRTLGKVLKVARKLDSKIMSASDLVRPISFDIVIEAARHISGYDAKIQEHQTYSNALTVGYALKDLAVAVKNDYIKTGLKHKVVEVDEFLKLRKRIWHEKVTASALRQRDEVKWCKPLILPLTEDCQRNEPSGNLPQDVITESNLQTVIRRGNRSTSDDELPPQKCPRFSERIRKQKMAESEAVTEDSSVSCSNQLEDKVPSHNTCKPSAFVADDISSDEHGGEYGSGHGQTQPLAAAAADMPSTSSKHTPYVASSRRISNHRVWNLYSYCLYCYQKETKLLRHCRRQHTSEELVAEAMALEECNSDAAHRIWSKIRNLGNHAHNKEVLLGRADDLIVRKRPENGKSRAIDDYVPCSDCLGYFNTRSLWIHKKTCYERDHSLKGSQHVKEGRSLLPLKLTIHDQLKKVVDGMVHDDITLIAKNDKFILHVGQNEMDKSNSFKKDNISRQKMRTLGKVLKVARKLDSKIMSASDLVRLSSFDVAVAAARRISGYDAKIQEHQTYSNALRVGYALKDLAVAVKNDYIKTGLIHKVVEVDEFLTLRKRDWHEKVTASALTQRDKVKWFKPLVIPLIEDCQRRYNKWRKSQEKYLFKQPEIKKLLKKQQVPGKMECEMIIKRGKSIFSDKTWKDVKNKIHNKNNLKKRKLRRKDKNLHSKKTK